MTAIRICTWIVQAAEELAGRKTKKGPFKSKSLVFLIPFLFDFRNIRPWLSCNKEKVFSVVLFDEFQNFLDKSYKYHWSSHLHSVVNFPMSNANFVVSDLNKI